MTTTIIIVVGIVHFIDAIFEKTETWDQIGEYGADQGSKLIYELLNCRFCLLFHIAWIITLFYGVICSFSWGLLIVPFICSGISHLINKR